MYALGIDLGSTTIKYALLSGAGETLSSSYVRHQSDVRGTLISTLRRMTAVHPEAARAPLRVRFAGSGALHLAEALHVPFVQEVLAAALFLRARTPGLDAAVELGGEDAKLLYLSNGVELRMNEACAGGTGAFIDQMASLLDTDAAGLNALAAEAAVSHPIASRCGVFAKTDIVSLLNAGVPKTEIARSVFDAVAEQTIGGLACGRAVRGRVAFLGGPLSFLSELREAFKRKLARDCSEFAEFEDGHLAVAWGAAKTGLDEREEAAGGNASFASLQAFIEALEKTEIPSEADAGLPALFASAEERREFETRHASEKAERMPLEDAAGPLFLGIDLGSTTVKGRSSIRRGGLPTAGTN